ncbi:hypothetical protein [Brevibacillus brevis]|uniref:hypothetical protein n=1 Tax=Brevibacillus brevis TaxID=1393 RepID=UPI000AA5EBA2|nr:hypothetical protein [Brevibacillus brevis]
MNKILKINEMNIIANKPESKEKMIKVLTLIDNLSDTEEEMFAILAGVTETLKTALKN